MEIATLAGGCFWCTEAIFQRLKGVIKVESGYANSKVENPSYQAVCEGKTGAAEAIQITFDPKIIFFEKLLDVFWQLHDPTTLNRQGNDVGTQYKSAIFYTNDEQKRLAQQSKQNLEKSGIYQNPVVTEITLLKNFYLAEDYHKDYYDKNRSTPYCKIVIDPKITKLMKNFKKDLKANSL